MFTRLFIRLNNRITRMRRVRFCTDELLLLVPRCIQKSTCSAELGETLNDCRRCGQCDVQELLDISEESGVRCSLAAGGHEALAYVNDPRVKAVVAVACEKELFQGICAVFPKPVLGVLNIQGGSPCRNTKLDPKAIRSAIRLLTR